MADTIRFFAKGTPKPLARPRATTWRGKDGRNRARVYDDGSSKEWGERVRAAGWIVRPREPISEPVAVSLTFYLPRPKRLAKASAEPIVHAVKPDLDNLAKKILDVISGRFIADDKLVFKLVASKWYAGIGKPCGVEIVIHGD